MRRTGVGAKRRRQPFEGSRSEDRDDGAGPARNLGGDIVESRRLDGQDDQIGTIGHLGDRREPLAAELVRESLGATPSLNR